MVVVDLGGGLAFTGAQDPPGVLQEAALVRDGRGEEQGVQWRAVEALPGVRAGRYGEQHVAVAFAAAEDGNVDFCGLAGSGVGDCSAGDAGGVCAAVGLRPGVPAGPLAADLFEVRAGHVAVERVLRAPPDLGSGTGAFQVAPCRAHDRVVEGQQRLSVRRSPAGAGLLQEGWPWLGSHARGYLLELGGQQEKAIGTAGACRVLGKSRSALHRHRNPKPPAPAAEGKEFRHPAELAPEEKERVLRELDSPRFADKSVAQAYTVLLDEGCYLCSQASMHRLLRERGTSGERRAHASHPARKKPELLAAGPNEIWSWDITKLKGPDRGTWYLLYVNGGIKPKAVHAGRGTPMTSSTVSGLYAKLNIVQSFFTYYNTEHRHSGIAMHTPSSVHDGTWAQVQGRRPPPSGPPTRPTRNGSAAAARSPGPCRTRSGSTNRRPPSRTATQYKLRKQPDVPLSLTATGQGRSVVQFGSHSTGRVS